MKTATQTITVTVTDVGGEAPGKPDAPDVAPASVTSLTVNWSAPDNAARRSQTTTSSTGRARAGAGATGATPARPPRRRSRAFRRTRPTRCRCGRNDEGTTGRTTRTRRRRQFIGGRRVEDDGRQRPTATRTTTSRATRSPAARTRTSSRSDLRGAARRRNFDAQDSDTGNTYVVEVQATSGAGERVKTATQTITVTVTDVGGEAPGKPDAPDVAPASVTSLTVNWSAPDNGGPAITDYDVQYRAGTSGSWSDGGHTGTATTATLTGHVHRCRCGRGTTRARRLVGLGQRRDGRQRGAGVQLIGDVRRAERTPARCWRRTTTTSPATRSPGVRTRTSSRSVRPPGR